MDVMDQMTSMKLDYNDELMTSHEVAARLRVTIGALASLAKLEKNPLPVHRLGSGPRAPEALRPGRGRGVDQK